MDTRETQAHHRGLLLAGGASLVFGAGLLLAIAPVVLRGAEQAMSIGSFLLSAPVGTTGLGYTLLCLVAAGVAVHPRGSRYPLLVVPGVALLHVTWAVVQVPSGHFNGRYLLALMIGDAVARGSVVAGLLMLAVGAWRNWRARSSPSTPRR